MVSSLIINKRYNSNEVNYTSENIYIYIYMLCRVVLPIALDE
jgi:hypothetical protein